jgi:hypothetical protein
MISIVCPKHLARCQCWLTGVLRGSEVLEG